MFTTIINEGTVWRVFHGLMCDRRQQRERERERERERTVMETTTSDPKLTGDAGFHCWCLRLVSKTPALINWFGNTIDIIVSFCILALI